MSYDAECYCADNDGVPCVFCEMETNTRLRLLARNIRDAAVGCESFYRGTALGVEVHDDPYRASRNWGWEPGHALPSQPNTKGDV